jgi:pimeloyl-ACP methyl ester carboxylesterase
MRLRLALIMGLASAAQLAGQSAVSPEYPPLGRLIDIDGRKLHLHCSGRGSPTIVLVAGGGAYSIDWALIQPRIDSVTRVCSYDRAGLAWSDPGPADETVEQTIDDLHVVLQSAGERAPYVLVGASIGGIFIRAYQHAFPADVAGLVFTNSVHRIGKFVPGKSGLIWDLSEDEIRSAYPLPPSVTKGPAPTRTTEPFDRLPPALQATRLWFDRRRWETWDRTKVGPQADLSWRREFVRELDEKCSGREHPLGALPLIVVSSDPKPSQPESQRPQGRQSCGRDDAGDGLDLLSSNSMYVVAAGSGHEIHLYQPAVLLQALVRGVLAVRTQSPLARVSEHP